jgi:pimeloyl-ACP methyl ester carboxylesterase
MNSMIPIRGEPDMSTVVSKDGTRIGYDVTGDGPPLILVDGALCYRRSGPNGDLAKELASRFTVYTYDRRGRGESTDTQPYDVQREVEDIAALIEAAGDSVHVYGISSGAALALEAARAGLPIEKLALYEASFVVDDSRKLAADDYAERLDRLVAEGKRGDAVKVFMREGIGLPGIVVTMMRLMPAWKTMTGLAHTLPYDTVLTFDKQRGKALPADDWAGLAMPVLVVAGGKSPAWMQNAMRALAEAVPGARHHTLPGQTHLVKAAALAPVLADFFSD